MLPLLMRWRHALRRELSILGQVVFGDLGRAIFIGAAMDDGNRVEVTVRRRGRGNPFKRVRLPGIPLGLLPGEQAPEEIDYEGDLREPERNRAPGDEHIDRLQWLQELVLHRVVDPPHHPAYAKDVHREKGAVVRDERREEVDLPQRLVHHAPEHLWEPVVDTG